jgi:hypothetical protein
MWIRLTFDRSLGTLLVPGIHSAATFGLMTTPFFAFWTGRRKTCNKSSWHSRLTISVLLSVPTCSLRLLPTTKNGNQR